MEILRALVFAAAAAATGLSGIKVDAPPPDVAFPMHSGPMHLSALRGKVVVVHFWATWCHYCLDELPRFVKLKQTFGDRIAVVTVSNEPQDVAASYLRLWNIDLPLAEDTQSAVFKAYGVGPLPDTVIVDATGNVSAVQLGESSLDDLQKATERALGSL